MITWNNLVKLNAIMVKATQPNNHPVNHPVNHPMLLSSSPSRHLGQLVISRPLRRILSLWIKRWACCRSLVEIRPHTHGLEKVQLARVCDECEPFRASDLRFGPVLSSLSDNCCNGTGMVCCCLTASEKSTRASRRTSWIWGKKHPGSQSSAQQYMAETPEKLQLVPSWINQTLNLHQMLQVVRCK